MTKKIWVTWETQRRSIELSKALGCKLYIFDISGPFRYPLAILKTLAVLIKDRPEFFFVQNPSMFLAALACFYGSIFKTKVIVDRHTTFRLNKPHSGSFSIWLFMRLHYYTLRSANLTIVTNDFLADIVKKAKGRPAVLPDKLPTFITTKRIPLKGRKNILLISSFGKDEPIDEVIKTAALLPEDCFVYITGNYKKKFTEAPILPLNVVLTGFIPEDNFVAYVHSVDIIMALTTSDYCMLCGCYEAVAAEKPLITSDKLVLREYFKDAIFVNDKAEGIVEGIKQVLSNEISYKEKAITSKKVIATKWSLYFSELEMKIATIGNDQE